MKQNIKAFLQLLTQDNRSTFNEGFSDNDGKRQGTSFENYLNKELVDTGFKDFTEECDQLHPSQSKLQFELFGNFATKKSRNLYHRWFKANLEDNTLEVLKTLKSPAGFIEQPLSSKRQPDIFIWWTNEDGSQSWLLVDVKTGGGRCPKVNDREIGWNHLVIFNSRHKTVADRPTTIAFARDIFSKEEYKKIAEIKQEMGEVRKELKEKQKHHKTIRFNFRDRVEILAPLSNWFEIVEGKTREQREQLALDSL